MDIIEAKFFGGQVTVFQPKDGYRAGTDAVLLAASLAGKSGEQFLELGVGSGIVTLLASHHNPDCHFTGLERSSDMLALSRRNTKAHENIGIVEGSIRDLPKDWHLKFDQVFTNPPYFDKRAALRMSKAKEPSFVNQKSLTIKDWIEAMLLMLKPRGVGTLIYRADGVEKVLATLGNKAGRIKILPIHAFAVDPAKRVMVQFRKGVKSETTLLPALVLHERGKQEKFTPIASKIISGEAQITI